MEDNDGILLDDVSIERGPLTKGKNDDTGIELGTVKGKSDDRGLT